MGVSAKKLVYDFSRKFDALISGTKRNMPVVDKIAYLNEAQEIWFRAVTKIAETDNQIRQDLSSLEVKNEELVLSPQDKYTIARFPKNMFKRLNQRAIVSCKSCCPGFKKEITLTFSQADDIHEDRLNEFRKADFAWEQLPVDEGSEGLYLYHDGEMEIEKVIIDYYRNPTQIHAPSLVICDGPGYYDYCGIKITADQDFEIDSRYLDNKIVDIAVLLAKRDKGELQDFNSRLQSLLQLDSILKV